MFWERLFACMRDWVRVCGVGCMFWCKLRKQPGPGPAGSWAGPAWFKMLLGLGGTRVVGGGERGGGPPPPEPNQAHLLALYDVT